MAPRRKLSPTDRAFFSLVTQAVFSNPFSDERDALDRQLTGITGRIKRRNLLREVTSVVSHRVEQLAERGRASLKDYVEDDAAILHNAFLFDVFHRFALQFDELILDQVSAGSTPCPVPFADDALAVLEQRGFGRAMAIDYFGMFYQLRRAFYFIDRALLGRSASMKELRRHLWNNVFTSDILWYDRYLRNRMEDFSTLLLGETGTGKGTAAAAIGRSGFIPFNVKKQTFACSFTDAFVSLNLSQFPETLIESELFGHRKGAFTGAVENHEGIFARCSAHGAIFLDEIGDVGIPVQIKLLQVLQERTFSPVGSHEQLRFEGRVIAATNKPIDELRQSGRFRDDFFYRLCSDIITVPPLRDRVREDPGELEDLLDEIIHRLAGQPAPELREAVRDVLARVLGPEYGWPGNVRELEQAARRILLTRQYEGDDRVLTADRADHLGRQIRDGSIAAEDLLAQYCQLLYERHGTYEEVARRAGLDRRTAKKYILAASVPSG